MTNRLKHLRKQRGLTQQALAELINTTHSTVGRIESGKRGLNEEWVWKLSRALDCHPGELFAPLPATGVEDQAEKGAALIARRMSERDREAWFSIGLALIKETRPKVGG